uniref:hypothetical protein n=1 Tax=Agathobacter sp. TaxID=2021311 RepID=UPI0040567456
MDYNNYNPYDNSGNNHSNHSSNPNGYNRNYYATQTPANLYEKFAFGLGVASILTCSIFYISFVAGAMAILFALLSRGGDIKLSPKARLAILLGIIGIVVTVAFYVWAFQIALAEYGSPEGILREACEMAGYDFETLYGDFFQ